MKKTIKSYMKYGDKCGIASAVQAKTVDAEPHPRHKGMWRFVDDKGQAWVASDYAFDEDDDNEREDEATNEGDLAYCDDFLCSKCGIHLTDWFRIDAKEDDCYEYEFKFCPNCGAKIVNHD